MLFGNITDREKSGEGFSPREGGVAAELTEAWLCVKDLEAAEAEDTIVKCHCGCRTEGCGR